MLTSFTLSLVHFVIGIVTGIYLPLAVLYLVGFVRKGHFGLKLIWQAILRVFMVLFGFIMVMAALGFVEEMLGSPEQLEEYAVWIGFGLILGLFAGIVLFIVGLRRARSTPTMLAS